MDDHKEFVEAGLLRAVHCWLREWRFCFHQWAYRGGS